MTEGDTLVKCVHHRFPWLPAHFYMVRVCIKHKGWQHIWSGYTVHTVTSWSRPGVATGNCITHMTYQPCSINAQYGCMCESTENDMSSMLCSVIISGCRMKEKVWQHHGWCSECLPVFITSVLFLPVNFQSFMLRASPLMHILSLLLTLKLQGRSIYRALCYALSLQHVI